MASPPISLEYSSAVYGRNFVELVPPSSGRIPVVGDGDRSKSGNRTTPIPSVEVE
jgi:hypothetical protein